MKLILDYSLGLIACWCLFYQLRRLNTETNDEKILIKSISMIIPARNEAEKLPYLLNSLQSEKDLLKEIIVVDDHSSDLTKEIATAYGVKVIEAGDRDESWVGKSYACFEGVKVATGDIYLFVDADTIFERGAITQLIKTYDSIDGVLSVQPYHRVEKWFEQCSLYFNLILVGGMHSFSSFSNPKTAIGLFGPVIMIDASQYQIIGGHEVVKNKVIEDIALGQILKIKQVKLYNYIGKGCISFNMYDNLPSLIEGWTKNFALGAKSTSLSLFIVTLIWISCSLTVAFVLIMSLITNQPLLIPVLFYGLYVGQLYLITKQLGSFKQLVVLLYPIYILIFICIFCYSLIKTFIFKRVKWKGRPIKV